MTTERNRLRLAALAEICQQLGGKLVIVSRHEFDKLIDDDDDSNISIPMTVGSRYEYGIDWTRKIVYVQRGSSDHIGYIIHEAGHVFADRHPPDNAKCDEWKWLGWEIAVARQIGAWNAWTRQNGSYHLGDGLNGRIGKDKDWRDLSTKERRVIIADRLEHAKKIGVLNTDGTPGSVR